MSFLSIRNLSACHGLLQAVQDFSLDLAEGETIALVGANGAGKTTLMRTLAGAHRAASGSILFDGSDITALNAHRRVAQGIALVPEGRKLFPQMTVDENLLSARAAGRSGYWNLDTVREAFPVLMRKCGALASHLSGGEQQATAIGRALMTNPRALLLDEVSLGLSPIAVEGLYKSLEGLFDGRATVVLVEQDLGRAMSIAKRVVCMLEGRIELIGETAKVTHEQVTEAYFGLGKKNRNGGEAR